MTITRAVLAGVPLAMLVACGDRPPAAAAEASRDRAAKHASAAPAPVEAAAPLTRLRGNAVLGKDGYGITLCGESTQRIAEFDTAAEAALGQFLAGGAREFFIDGWGQLGAEDGKPRLSAIERVYSEGPGWNEDLQWTVLRARGNEPFWSLILTRQGGLFERPDQPAAPFAYTALTGTSADRRLQVSTPAGALEVSITPGLCSDGMSDTLYGSRATVTLGSETFTGCAFAGLAR